MKIYLLYFFLFIYADTIVGQDSCFSDYYKAERIYFSSNEKHNSIEFYRKSLVKNQIKYLSIYYNTFWKSYKMDSIDFCNELQKVMVSTFDMSFNSYLKFIKDYPDFKFKLDSISFFDITKKRKSYKLDSLLLFELKLMEKRDQYIRENERYEELSILDYSNISDMNFSSLKTIVALNDGNLPRYNQVGSEGIEIIKLLIVHMDLDQLNCGRSL